jgi:hypothetical protein
VSERTEKIKQHFKDNKEIYVIGSIFTCAGFTWYIMRDRHAALLRGADGLKTADASVTVRPLSFFSPTEIVTTIHTGNRGHSGFRTRNIEHNIVFDTQADAARAFNISPANLSSHLNGKFEDVDGLHFERVLIY